MRELVFALEFKGKAGAVPGRDGKRQARTTASSQMLSTMHGTITYGAAGMVAFETIGPGWVGPGPAPGSNAGGVLWKITGGDGRFANAQGLITSNFTVGAAGDVVDNHFARIYLP